MKRRLATVFVFLVLGAIVNVAVAWGCAQSANLGQPDWLVDAQPARWRYERAAGFGSVRVTSSPTSEMESTFHGETPTRRLGPTWSRVNDYPDGRARVVEDARGWPATSLMSEWTLDDLDVEGGWKRAGDTFFLPEVWRINWGIRLRDGMRADEISTLPLRPIWPGFAINTLFYAGVLWLLVAAPFALRRRRRIKRGLCPKCAYPVGTWGGERCTECGHIVRTAGEAGVH